LNSSISASESFGSGIVNNTRLELDRKTVPRDRDRWVARCGLIFQMQAFEMTKQDGAMALTSTLVVEFTIPETN
jgi:hypothetical protein